MNTEIISIKYSRADLEAFGNGHLSATDFFERSLSSQPVQFAHFKDLLLTNHTEDGGAPQILDLKVISAEYDSETLKGKVIFTYRVGYTYACARLNPEMDRKETCSFTVDMQNSLINISFLRIDSLSTADEL